MKSSRSRAALARATCLIAAGVALAGTAHAQPSTWNCTKDTEDESWARKNLKVVIDAGQNTVSLNGQSDKVHLMDRTSEGFEIMDLSFAGYGIRVTLLLNTSTGVMRGSDASESWVYRCKRG